MLTHIARKLALLCIVLALTLPAVLTACGSNEPADGSAPTSGQTSGGAEQPTPADGGSQPAEQTTPTGGSDPSQPSVAPASEPSASGSAPQPTTLVVMPGPTQSIPTGSRQTTEEPGPASGSSLATEQPTPTTGGQATEEATPTAPAFTAISGSCGLLREDYQMPSDAWLKVVTSFPTADDVPQGLLLRAGTVACWVPRSDYTIETPEDEAFEDVLVAISSGLFYGCGLREDGSPVCWGRNSDGQASPPEGETFIAISSGQYHTCGLRADGSAKCWGLVSRQFSPAEGETFVAISSGHYHTCGLRADGSVACWLTGFGDDYGSGQLLPEGETFTAISSGGRRTCGLRENGSAACGGDVGPPEGETFVAISHTCGLREDGSVICWGDYGSVEWAIPVNSASVGP